MPHILSQIKLFSVSSQAKQITICLTISLIFFSKIMKNIKIWTLTYNTLNYNLTEILK